MATSGTIDCNALVLPSPALPWLSFKFWDDGPMLKAIIGGTQGHTVWLTGLSINPAQRNYTMELRYLIRDDFGVDSSDLLLAVGSDITAAEAEDILRAFDGACLGPKMGFPPTPALRKLTENSSYD